MNISNLVFGLSIIRVNSDLPLLAGISISNSFEFIMNLTGFNASKGFLGLPQTSWTFSAVGFPKEPLWILYSFLSIL